MTESKTVRLGDLEHDPVSVAGREDRLVKIDDLLASIPAMGQLQSLRVRPWAGEGTMGKTRPLYAVVAGNRRLATLRAIAAAKGEIQGLKVDQNFLVHVILGDDDDQVAYAGSVAENVQRLPETPAGEFRAFAKMAETKPPKEIAATFGVTEKRVLQRLKLAQLHPDVLAALEADKITMAAAEAFTLAEPDKQAKYLSKAHSYQLEPHTIRRAFTDTLINGKSPIAKIIGLKAYKAAGGKVMGDHFTDDAYWLSKDLIDDLLLTHWESEVAKWKAEGWSFVETVEQYCGSQGWKVQQSEQLKPEGKGKGKDAVPVFTAEQKASAGVVYYPDGSRAPYIGIKRYKEARGSSVPEVVDLRQDLDFDLEQKLVGELCRASATAVLAAGPAVGLRLLVATLKTGRHQNKPLELMRRYDLPCDGGSEEKPVSFATALADTEGMSVDDLVGALTLALAPGFEILQPLDDGEVAFANLVRPIPYFAIADFFNDATMTKPFLLAALADMTDPGVKQKPPKGKVEELRAKCIDLATDTGWLPPQIRLPDYAGPCFVTNLAEDEGGDPDVEDDAFNDDESQLEAAE